MLFSEVSQGIALQAQEIELPKIIHFVWAGGSKQMPIANQRRVRDWANQHPEFQIYVWVDYTSASGNTREEQKAYVEKEYKKSLELENPDLGLLASCNNVKLKDVFEDLYNSNTYADDLAYKFFRYEIDRLSPNYGASSDILRYKILYELGGVYFDSDILVGQKKLDQNANFGELEQHVIYIDPNSQDQGFIGNDAFIVTTKYNSIIQKILEECFKSYCAPPAIPIENFCRYYDNKEFITQSTLSRTGPQVVMGVFEDGRYSSYKYFDSFKEEQPIKYGCLIFALDPSCRSIQANEQNWVGTGIRGALSKQEVLDKMINSSAIEYEYFKILRFNDHFYNYYELLNEFLSMDHFLIKLQQKLQISKVDFSFVRPQELNDLNYWKIQIEEKGNDSFCSESVREVLHFFNATDESQRNVAIQEFNARIGEQKSVIESYKNRPNSPRLV